MGEIEMSDTDADLCSETDKLPNPTNDLLNTIWKMIHQDKMEEDRGG
jgi:hypothetical protein